MVDAFQQGIDAVAGQQHGIDDLLHLLHGEGNAAIQGLQRVGPVLERVDEQEQAAGLLDDGPRLLGHSLRLLVDVAHQAARAAVDVVQHVLLAGPDVLQRVHGGGRFGFGGGIGTRFFVLGLVVLFGIGLVIGLLGGFISQGTGRADERGHLPAGVSGEGRHEAEDGQQHENGQGTEQAAIHGPPQRKASAEGQGHHGIEKPAIAQDVLVEKSIRLLKTAFFPFREQTDGPALQALPCPA